MVGEPPLPMAAGAHRDEVDPQAVPGSVRRPRREPPERSAKSANATLVNGLHRTASATRLADFYLDRDQHAIRVVRDEVELPIRASPSAGEDDPAACRQPGCGRFLGALAECMSWIGHGFAPRREASSESSGYSSGSSSSSTRTRPSSSISSESCSPASIRRSGANERRCHSHGPSLISASTCRRVP